MKKENNSLSGTFYPIRILLLLLVACLTLLFPNPVQADIIQEQLTNGVHLKGTEVISFLDDMYREELKMPSSDPADYSLSISVSFDNPQQAPATLPKWIIYSVDGDSVTMYNKGSTTYSDKRTLYNVHPSELKLSFPLDEEDEWDGNIDEYTFSLDFTLQEVPKPSPAVPKPTVKPQPAAPKLPKVSLEPNSINPLYPGDNDTLSLSISDPELPYWEYVQPEQVSVRFSDPSIVSLTKKDFLGTSLQLHIRAKKAGTTQCIVTYRGVSSKQSITVHKTSFYVPSSASITLKQKKHISNYVFQMGIGKCSIKNVKSNKKSVISVSGKKLTARKPGKATITFTLNGKRKSIRFTVQRPAPKLNQLKVKISGYTYNPNTGKTYYYLTFRNTSQRTITKVKLRYTMTLNETITLTKNHKVNLKPGKTKRIKVYVGKLITDPQNRKVKCLKLWYK